MSEINDSVGLATDEGQRRRGLSRRDVIKRGAIAGAAVAWAVPVVEAIGSPGAFAAGSPVVSNICEALFSNLSTFKGTSFSITYTVSGGPPTVVTYSVSSSGVLSVTSGTDVFHLTINSTATKISGTVPAADTIINITVSTTSDQVTFSNCAVFAILT